MVPPDRFSRFLTASDSACDCPAVPLGTPTPHDRFRPWPRGERWPGVRPRNLDSSLNNRRSLGQGQLGAFLFVGDENGRLVRIGGSPRFPAHAGGQAPHRTGAVAGVSVVGQFVVARFIGPQVTA